MKFVDEIVIHELKVLKKRWKKRIDDLLIFYTLIEKIFQAKSTNEIFELITYHSAHLLNAKAASLLLIDENNFLEFKNVFCESKYVQLIKELRLEIGQGIAGSSAKLMQPIIVNKPYEDSRFDRKFDIITGFLTKNILTIPLIHKNKCYGVIEVINKIKGDFNEEDLNFLSDLAYILTPIVVLYNSNNLLQKHLNNFDNIFNSLPGGYIAINKEGKIIEFNKKAYELLSMPEDKKIIGLDYFDVLGKIGIATLFKETEQTGKPRFRGEIQIKVNATVKIIGYSSHFIKNEKEEIIGIGITFQDITNK